jgi:hypothetical protein
MAIAARGPRIVITKAKRAPMAIRSSSDEQADPTRIRRSTLALTWAEECAPRDSNPKPAD